jgi:hypothetical protein
MRARRRYSTYPGRIRTLEGSASWLQFFTVMTAAITDAATGDGTFTALAETMKNGDDNYRPGLVSTEKPSVSMSRNTGVSGGRSDGVKKSVSN